MKLSFEEIRGLLYKAVCGSEGESGCWITTVYDDEVVDSKDGKLYRAPYSVTDGAVNMGSSVEVREETKYVPVFSVERLFHCFKNDAGNGFVVRSGKLFEAGDYPDKGVEFDIADLQRAVSDFQPVPNDLEHRSTVLDGKLGTLEKVWMSGDELHGDVMVPDWLDKAIGDEPIKVSLAFDREKRIVGNALVLRPRIEDAAIFTAFSATLSAGNPPKKETAMKLKQILLHLFGSDKIDPEAEVTLPSGFSLPETPAEPIPDTQAPTQPAAPAPAQPANDPATAFNDSRIRALEQRLLGEKAYQFADSVIASKKAVPAQRESIAAQYRQAVTHDAGGGSMFSENAEFHEGESTKALRQFFETAPAHSFVGEAFTGGNVGVLHFGSESKEGMSSDRRKELLGKTELGRDAEKAASK